MIENAFTEILPSHQSEVNLVTRGFPPYCDFQFSNMLSWSLPKQPTLISLQDNNLLVKMREYDTDRVVTMFMGKTNTVFNVYKAIQAHGVLERVPEEVADEITKSPEKDLFCVSEDTGNHDYIINLENIIKLAGRRYKSKRKSVSKFCSLYSAHSVQVLDPADKNTIFALRDLFRDIAEEKNIGFEILSDEFQAVVRLLSYSELLDINIMVVFYENKLVGFTINEVLHESPYKIALGCFGKSLRKYRGLFSYMEFVTAEYLLKQGTRYINLEEDMGFDGLKMSKVLWRPDKLLKKYIIKLRS